MDLISQIVERAKANKQRIVLPEGTEERALKDIDRWCSRPDFIG